METLSILGSTGSIGTQALDVCRGRGYKPVALAAHSNVKLLEQQIREFSPALAALTDEAAARDLKTRVADMPVKVLSGVQGVCECAGFRDADTVLNAVVGMAGLRPTLAAIHAKKRIALANKETLVAGGPLIIKAAEDNGVKILPVDSEHSAIFQCLQAAPPNRALKRVILTASGGPFFGKTRAELENVTLADALKHPNWSMGSKITIDSATMFNKGLELIEAVWLFGVKPENVDIVVHRESIVHSLIEFDDNSVLAQLGYPDMRLPIQYALTYPERYPSPERQLSLAQVGTLSFFEPDNEAFPCINICRRAIIKGGLAPAAANSANEEANRLFREGKIRFADIAGLIGEAAQAASRSGECTLENIEAVDFLMRSEIQKLSKR